MKKVSIITTPLFDEMGKEITLGGNQRYLLDILKLYESMSLKCNVYQPSKVNFENRLNKNINIIGIPFNKIDYQSYLGLNKKFHHYATEADFVHYQSFTLGYPYTHKNSVGICHGISWDLPIGKDWESGFSKSDYYKNKLKKRLLLKHYYKACSGLKKIVANDTNFINWARVTWPEIVNKVTYIPNYVDIRKFSPQICKDKDRGLTILFPRRLTNGRGFEMALLAAEHIIKKYHDVKFVFTGDQPKNINGKLIDDIRIKFKKASFTEIKELYLSADVVIIPTLHSEGTSLSCLEAMACGVPVIATDVGGLANLIIDGYNGLLIPPNYRSLIRAIETLIKNENMRAIFAERGLETVQAFSKDKWEDRWIELLEDIIK